MNRLPLLLAGAYGLVLGVLSRNAMSDDAYINLRIARHALEGLGWHYNAGEQGVQAATSPLNLLLTTLFGKATTLLGFSVEAALLLAANILFCLSLTALAIGSYVLLRRYVSSDWAPLFGAALAVSSPLLLFSAGLETALFLSLCVWSAVALHQERYFLCGVLGGFAVLARHDALLFLGLVCLAVLLRKGAAMKVVQGAVLPLLPWFVFSALYFQQTVPTTLATKMAQGGTMYWPGPYYAQFWKQITAASFGQQAVAILVCAFAVAGIALAFRNRAYAIVTIVSFGVLHFVAYSILGVPDYHWYFAPYFVILALAAGYAALHIKPAAVPVALAASTALIGIWKAPREDERLQTYKEVGEYLESNAKDAVVGMMEIGAVGFFASNVRIFDFSGVVTPSQIPRVAGNDATSWLEQPTVVDKVVIRGSRHPLEPDFDTRFEEYFEKEYATPATKLFPNGLQVWRRKS